MGALDLVKNNKIKEMTKHIHVHHHFIRQQVSTDSIMDLTNSSRFPPFSFTNTTNLEMQRLNRVIQAYLELTWGINVPTCMLSTTWCKGLAPPYISHVI